MINGPINIRIRLPESRWRPFPSMRWWFEILTGAQVQDDHKEQWMMFNGTITIRLLVRSHVIEMNDIGGVDHHVEWVVPGNWAVRVVRVRDHRDPCLSFLLPEDGGDRNTYSHDPHTRLATVITHMPEYVLTITPLDEPSLRAIGHAPYPSTERRMVVSDQPLDHADETELEGTIRFFRYDQAADRYQQIGLIHHVWAEHLLRDGVTG